jgi:hypothetical protein
VRDRARNGYDGNVAAVFKDLMHGGCSSGIVGHLIYNVDCERFFRTHRKEIGAMLGNLLREACLDLSGHSVWDETDPLALETPNQVFLAHLGFEEAARALADRAGIDV